MNNVIDKIKEIKVIPVIKINNLDEAIPLIESIINAGINVIEITLRTSIALDVIRNVAHLGCIGAGTVLNINQAKAAVEAGAKFIVSPGFDEEVVLYCKSQDVLVIPGCITPSEIMKAIKHDLRIVKYFPAESFGGVNAIKALTHPFPNINFLPTGGINLTNIREYLELKNVIACAGSWMVKESYLLEKQYDIITNNCMETVKLINKI